MAPVAQHKRIYRGEAKTFRITVTDDELEDVFDLSALGEGDDIEFNVSEKDGARSTVIQKTLSDGVEIVTPHEDDNIGLADITIESADTAELDTLKLRYEVILVYGGERYTIIPASDFTVLESVAPPPSSP